MFDIFGSLVKLQAYLLLRLWRSRNTALADILPILCARSAKLAANPVGLLQNSQPDGCGIDRDDSLRVGVVVFFPPHHHAHFAVTPVDPRLRRGAGHLHFTPAL